MILDVIHLLGATLCVLALIWCAHILGRAVMDAHQRGMARVHRGTSWTPKVTSSRDEQAAA